jgi:hypothetical protein
VKDSAANTAIDTGPYERVPGFAAATALTTNARTACARRADNEWYCWGEPTLGLATSQSCSVPVAAKVSEDRPCAAPAPLPNRYLSVSVGGVATCAVRLNGHVQCTGDNSYGTLGH